MLMACAQNRVAGPNTDAKLDRSLVRDAVVFEAGAKDGAVIPEILAPRLRAIFVEEKIENNRLIEAHREWLLEGEAQILGIPRERKKPSKVVPARAGDANEN